MDKCNAKILLKQNNIKITKQRELLLETIINSEKIFSAISLYEKVKNNMDLVTIYRILSIFIKNNIIREIVSNDTTHIYELSCIHHPVHPHFICKKCNEIICLNEINSNFISKLKDEVKDSIIEEIIIQFKGICSKCK